MRLAHRSFCLKAAGLRSALRRLIQDTSGTEAIEFAITSIPLFLFLLGAMDFARLYWTQSELQYAAEATARCATVNCCTGDPGPCGGNTGLTGLQQFAASRLLGISATSSDLLDFSLTSQACGNQVSFSYTYNFMIGPLIPTSRLTLTGSACSQA